MASRSGGISIRIDTIRVDDYLNVFPGRTGIALLRATKRGTKAAATMAKRVVAKDLDIKASDAQKAIRVIDPTGQTFTGEVRATLKRIPLIAFKARRWKTIRGAFIATMPASSEGQSRRHRGVFKRERKRRLPIGELYGASVGHVFVKHQGEIAARGEEQLLGELNRLLDRIME